MDNLASPSTCPNWLAAGAPLTGEQRGVARRLEAAVRVITRHPPVGSEDMGRSAARVETMEQALQRLSENFARALCSCARWRRWPATGDPLPGSSFSERPSEGTALLGRGRPGLWPEVAEAYDAGPDAEFLQGLYLTGETEIVAKDLKASRLKLVGRPSFLTLCLFLIEKRPFITATPLSS